MSEYNKHFHPILISSQSSTNRYGSNHYKLTTTYRPSIHDIREAQKRLGYDPKGYGAPFGVDVVHTGNKWVTRWQSACSCE